MLASVEERSFFTYLTPTQSRAAHLFRFAWTVGCASRLRKCYLSSRPPKSLPLKRCISDNTSNSLSSTDTSYLLRLCFPPVFSHFSPVYGRSFTDLEWLPLRPVQSTQSRICLFNPLALYAHCSILIISSRHHLVD